jgi:hypothetical protein
MRLLIAEEFATDVPRSGHDFRPNAASPAPLPTIGCSDRVAVLTSAREIALQRAYFRDRDRSSADHRVVAASRTVER